MITHIIYYVPGYSTRKPIFKNGRYYCDCGKSYKNRESWYPHKKYECGKEAQFQCPECPYKAKLKKNLRTHAIHRHGTLIDIQQLWNLPFSGWKIIITLFYRYFSQIYSIVSCGKIAASSPWEDTSIIVVGSGQIGRFEELTRCFFSCLLV